MNPHLRHFRDLDCIDSNSVGERRRDAPFDWRFERIQLVNAQRVVAVQMDGDFQTNAVHNPNRAAASPCGLGKRACT
jgi:hypothetical protein